MKDNSVTKKFLLKVILGDYSPAEHRDAMTDDGSLPVLQHQWDAGQTSQPGYQPDFRKLFEKIREKTHPENSNESVSTRYFIKEIEDLRGKNRILAARYRTWLSIAAGLLLLFGVASVIFLNQSQLLNNTITESIAPNGQKSQLVLADGTKVYLNSGTVLRYDNHFGKQNRRIELAGEAYFEVTKNKKIPFIIYTSDVEIKVLGTRFNVMAYPDDPSIKTTVTEGTVNVREIKGDKSLVLTANQQASYTKSDKRLVCTRANPIVIASWKENILYFDNENFENVINKLERWYDVSIRLEGKDSIDDRFTLTIKNESLREVLDLIGLTTPMRYKIRDNEVIISYRK
jgi:transmembrane sensor